MNMRVGNIGRRAIAAVSRHPAIVARQRVMAKRVLSEARGLVPVRSGALRRSLTVEEVRDSAGRIEMRVSWDSSIADYGPPVEFGTEDTSAQPHLRSAAIKLRGR